MLNECRAAIDACAEANEWHRVIKRFRILLGVSKKLCAALKDCSSESKENVEFTVGHVTPPHSRLAQRLSFSRSDSLVALNGDEADAFFESFGIAPATKNSILYSQSPVRDRPRRSNGVGIVAPNTVLSTQRMTRSKYFILYILPHIMFIFFVSRTKSSIAIVQTRSAPFIGGH